MELPDLASKGCFWMDVCPLPSPPPFVLLRHLVPTYPIGRTGPACPRRRCYGWLGGRCACSHLSTTPTSSTCLACYRATTRCLLVCPGQMVWGPFLPAASVWVHHISQTARLESIRPTFISFAPVPLLCAQLPSTWPWAPSIGCCRRRQWGSRGSCACAGRPTQRRRLPISTPTASCTATSSQRTCWSTTRTFPPKWRFPVPLRSSGCCGGLRVFAGACSFFSFSFFISQCSALRLGVSSHPPPQSPFPTLFLLVSARLGIRSRWPTLDWRGRWRRAVATAT